MSNGPMHSPLGPNRMNGMPINPSQQSSPHPQQMGNMPNMNAPNMMGNQHVNAINNSLNNTPASINNNSPSAPLSNVIMTNSGPNSNNTIPGSNNNNGSTTNTSNMNQNQMPPQNMGPLGPAGMYTGPKPMPVSAGKIYPADTPMVFNPQNPNAPPIYPCGVCHKEVHDNDQGLLCESGCNFWFHR